MLYGKVATKLNFLLFNKRYDKAKKGYCFRSATRSSTAPGGGISNIIIYWMDGDLDLSITMTMVSCILALGFTPLWLLVVPKLVPGEKFEVPITDILINLATVVVPALIGKPL